MSRLFLNFRNLFCESSIANSSSKTRDRIELRKEEIGSASEATKRRILVCGNRNQFYGLSIS
jgi:hypothetical protein